MADEEIAGEAASFKRHGSVNVKAVRCSCAAA
jgi:hypothetical protein